MVDKNKFPEVYVTPDYSVRVTDKITPQRDGYSNAELKSAHHAYVDFKEGLHTRGLLPEGMNETDIVSFKQNQTGVKTISYRVKPFAEFVADSRGISLEEYNHSNMPDMSLLQFHLQKGTVYALPLMRISRLFPQEFEQVEPQNFKMLVNGEVSKVKMGAEGIDYKTALSVLDVLFDGIAAGLTAKNIDPTPDRILSFWALSRFVELGHSVLSRSSQKKGPNHELDAFILDLVRLDAPLYVAFLAISVAANPQYHLTKKFMYSAATVAELKGIPRTFARHIILSE